MEHFGIVSGREKGSVGREARAEDGEEGFEGGEGVRDQEGIWPNIQFIGQGKKKLTGRKDDGGRTTEVFIPYISGSGDSAETGNAGAVETLAAFFETATPLAISEKICHRGGIDLQSPE